MAGVLTRSLHTLEATVTSTRPSPTSHRHARSTARGISLSPWWIACALCAGLAACKRTPPAPTTEGPPRFAESIAPIAAARCDSCHAKAPGGPMASYLNARSHVTPGEPGESLYYTLPAGHPAAWGDAAGLVRAWIEAGAQE